MINDALTLIFPLKLLVADLAFRVRTVLTRPCKKLIRRTIAPGLSVVFAANVEGIDQ